MAGCNSASVFFFYPLSVNYVCPIRCWTADFFNLLYRQVHKYFWLELAQKNPQNCGSGASLSNKKNNNKALNHFSKATQYR